MHVPDVEMHELRLLSRLLIQRQKKSQRDVRPNRTLNSPLAGGRREKSAVGARSHEYYIAGVLGPMGQSFAGDKALYGES